MTKYPLCFVAGTKVHTADGLKNIEEIRVGDVVVSRSEHDPSGDNSLRRVTELFVTHPKRLLTVRYRTGDTVEELTCTATHPFFVREQAGFVPAEELKVGWHFSLVDGQEATIEEIRETVAEEGASFTTYNFSVEEEHTYFVGPTGVWVHNMGSPCDEAMEVFLKYLADTDNPIIAAQAARNHLVSKIDKATEGAALYQKHLDDLDRLIYDELLSADDAKYVAEFAQWAHRSVPNGSFGGVVANTAEEGAFLRTVAVTFGDSSVFKAATRFEGNIIIQRSDIPFSVQNVRNMAAGRTPFVRNSHGEWEKLNLHHVGRQDGKLIEIFESQNRYDKVTGGPLHIPGPGGPTALPRAVREAYWRQRLQDAIDAGLVPQDILRQAGL